MIAKTRKYHPDMGVREIYFKIGPIGIGRDAFEKFCRKQGYMRKRRRNHTRTTDSSGINRFPNHMAEIKDRIDRPNQLWQSDIFYIEICGRFYYITLIQDAFLKIIVGFSASDSLITEATTLAALRMAIKRNRKYNLKGLVFHSDGGGQYYDKEFLKLTARHTIINSMCEYPWENGMAESLNNVIKNKYLIHRNITCLEELKLELDRTVSLYNQDKPHSSLQRKTPSAYEKIWLSLKGQKNVKVTESFDAKVLMNEASSNVHQSQKNAQDLDVISAKTN